MAEYIDREEAKKMVCQYSVFRAQLGGLMDVVSFLNDQTTVDAVPVVRCKDCKYYHMFEEGFRDCRHTGGLDEVNPDDFCSRGKRKDDE